MSYTKVQIGNTTWYRFGVFYEIRIEFIGQSGLLHVEIFQGTDTLFHDLVESLQTICQLEKDTPLLWEIVSTNNFLHSVARKVGFKVHYCFRPRHNRSVLVKVYRLKEPLL